MDGDQNKVQDAMVNTDAAGGGQQPGKVFTQEQVNGIVADRLGRAEAKYADYATLKEQAQKYAELQEQQKTEVQKLADAKVKAERERDEALAKAKSRLIKAAFVAEAAKAGAAHPEDVYALADSSKVTLDDSDNVVGVTEAVQAVIAAGRVPTVQAVRAPSLDGGAGGGKRASEQAASALSEDEIAQAHKLGLKPEDYAKGKRDKQGR